MPYTTSDGLYKISASRLNTWRQCPRKLAYTIDKYPQSPVDKKYINTGKAVHKILEDRINGIEKEYSTYIAEFKVPGSMMGVFDLCCKNAEKYFNIKGSPEKTIIKEFNTPKNHKCRLEAKIDLITENKIYDYKTGAKVHKDDFKIQGYVYHFATDDEFESVDFLLLQTNEVFPVKKAPIGYIPGLCDKYISTIEDMNFISKPSPLCDWCGYVRWCKGDLQNVSVFDVIADPEKYGMELYVYE